MTKQDLINHYGGLASAARDISARSPWPITPQAMTNWPGDYVPAGRQYQIEILTRGKLKADRLTSKK